MKQNILDKAVSKVSKGKINTVRVTKEELADKIDQYFIQPAVTEADYKAIWKVIKRGLLANRRLDSKDGNYQLRAESLTWGGLRRYIWVQDKAANTFYEYNYCYGFYGKFKKLMKNKIAQAQKGGLS